jgi:ribosome biogenesis GTPase
LFPAGELFENQVQVTTVKARELGRKGVVIGDRVRLVGDLSGAVDTLARLVEIIERETVLTRTADDSDPVERVIVANADQMAIVTAAIVHQRPLKRSCLPSCSLLHLQWFS